MHSLDQVPLVHVEGLIAPLSPPGVVVDVVHHDGLVAEGGVKAIPVPVALEKECKGGTIETLNIAAKQGPFIQ